MVVLLVGAGCANRAARDSNGSVDENAAKRQDQLFAFAESEFDFGVIKQSGGKVSHDFVFIYNGDEPITITGVPTSCACTSATVDKTKLYPGDSATLIVKFNPNLHAEPEGRFFKTVSFLTDSKIDDMPEVKIWVEIYLDLGPEAFELQSDHEEEEEEDGLTSYTSVTPEKFAGMLENKDFVLIDVHMPEQVHIEGTDQLIAYNEIEHSSKLPKDKDAKIVLYCRSGGMSRAAAYVLAEEGYTNVYDLAGGKNAYDAYLQSLEEEADLRATEKVGFIDFDARTITKTNKEGLLGEFTDSETSVLAIDTQKTNILLSLNNHRIGLGDFDYKALATLDGKAAEEWLALSYTMGGHHIAGILTFERDMSLGTLVIRGLPVGEAMLNFKKI